MIGHTEYDQDPTSKLWVQREYAKSLLQKIGSKANIEVLKSQKLSQAYKFGNREFDPKDSSLDKLVAAGASDAKISPDVLSALLTELEADLPGRQPVLFTLDGLERIMLPTAYRDQDFNIIHAHDLAIPNAFLSYLNGTRSFRRGLVMGATSASGAPRTEALEYAIMGKKLPNYSKLDPRVAASMEGAEVMVLGSMHKDEVKSLLEYCVDSGLLKDPTALQDEQLAQRYTLCSGLPKEVVASCVRIRC